MKIPPVCYLQSKQEYFGHLITCCMPHVYVGIVRTCPDNRLVKSPDGMQFGRPTTHSITSEWIGDDSA